LSIGCHVSIYLHVSLFVENWQKMDLNYRFAYISKFNTLCTTKFSIAVHMVHFYSTYNWSDVIGHNLWITLFLRSRKLNKISFSDRTCFPFVNWVLCTILFSYGTFVWYYRPFTTARPWPGIMDFQSSAYSWLERFQKRKKGSW